MVRVGACLRRIQQQDRSAESLGSHGAIHAALHRAYNFAVIYAGVGNKDKAFEVLNRAYDARSYLLAKYLNKNPHLDSLHDDPPFSALRIRWPERTLNSVRAN